MMIHFVTKSLARSILSNSTALAATSFSNSMIQFNTYKVVIQINYLFNIFMYMYIRVCACVCVCVFLHCALCKKYIHLIQYNLSSFLVFYVHDITASLTILGNVINFVRQNIRICVSSSGCCGYSCYSSCFSYWCCRSNSNNWCRTCCCCCCR